MILTAQNQAIHTKKKKHQKRLILQLKLRPRRKVVKVQKRKVLKNLSQLRRKLVLLLLIKLKIPSLL